MALRFNTFRANRYLRSKFVEGRYLLASEATDIELEILDALRTMVKDTIGDVAVEDAWKVEKLSNNQLLIKPGEAWFKGLPFQMRSGKDQLVSGAILTTGILPVGVSIDDDTSGLGKIITFNDMLTTPTNLYRVVISASEELITEVEDPFLQNANITESTAQKIRLEFKINIVPDALQTESPIPYRDENGASVSVTNFPSTGSFSSPNLVNQITITPTLGGNGEMVLLSVVTGAEKIDGRDLELTITNDISLGGGNPIPKSPSEQAAFQDGTLIDSNGNSYHINQIFLGLTSTQEIIRIDKEPDQPNPEIINTKPYTLIKRDVYVSDNVTGTPQGKLFWNIATVNWHSTNLLAHESSIVDLRNSVSSLKDYEVFINNKHSLRLTDGGTVGFTLSSQILSWSSALTLINPHGSNMTIASASVPLVEGGSLAYDINLSGGAIQKGTLAVNVTAFGSTSTLSAATLSNVLVGNVVKDSSGTVATITAVDDVNNTITTSPSLTANGSATIYYDSFGSGKVPLSKEKYVLAVRKSNKVYLNGLELQDGETTEIGDGISDQLITFIGSTGETDSSPNYSSNYYVVDGNSLVAAISTLDSTLNSTYKTATAAGVKILGGGTVSWTSPTLTFTADMYLEIKGLSYTDNTIQFSTQSPITLSSSLQAAYVIPNLTAGGPNLTVSVGSLSTIPTNALIIARREGTDVIVGSSSTRLKSGQSSTLYSQMSDQNLTYVGATDTSSSQPSYSSSIRGTANESLTSRAGQLTDAIGDNQEDRSMYLRSDNPVTWDGSSLSFPGNIIVEVINTKSGTITQHTISIANSPISLSNGESAWVSINRSSTSETLTLNKSGTLAIPAQTQANKDVIVLFRRVDVSGSGYLHIPLHKQIIEPNQTVRLGSATGASTNLQAIQNILTNVAEPFQSPNPLTSGTAYTAITVQDLSGNKRTTFDPNQTVRPAYGIERVGFKNLRRVPNEKGPNGEPVWRSDDERVRFVGANWTLVSTTSGTYPQTSVVGEYVEITFNGTALDLLHLGSHSILVSANGGASTSDSSSNTNIGGFGYSVNVVQNIASVSNSASVVTGLSASGSNTVKITNNTAINPLGVYGFDIITETSTVQASSPITIPPGTAYANGLSAALLTTQTTPYDSGFISGTLGTKGGRVVVYYDGANLQKILQPTSTNAPTYLASADHSSEDPIRTINWREFGTTGARDFNGLSTGSSDKYFVLNDGTTTLIGDNVAASGTTNDSLFIAGTGGNLTIVFVGTGLDIIRSDQGTGTIPNVGLYIDGVLNVSVLPTTATADKRVQKIVANLPYGTHTVRFAAPATVLQDFGLTDFIIYGPKKPSIPIGSIEIDEYFIMADYSRSTTQDSSIGTPLSQGILYKSPMRENFYSSGWTVQQVADVSTTRGFYVSTTSNNQAVTYTFFGTGIEIISSYTTTPNTRKISIDGTLYTGAAQVSYNGGAVPTWTPGTSTWLDGGTAGSSLQITGLPLGQHTIQVIKSSATDTFAFYGMNVITPIHFADYKNGSLSIKPAIEVAKLGEQDNVDLGKAKAWVTFDSTNSIVLASYNIASVVKIATGQYDVFFRRPFTSSNYAISGFIYDVSAQFGAGQNGNISLKTNHSIALAIRNAADTGYTDKNWSLAVFGELVDEEEEG
jgi:hypothetical protein